MQMTLNQEHLETAVRNYMETIGLNLPVVDVDFTATRGSEGIVTAITLGAIRSEKSLPTPVRQETTKTAKPHEAKERPAKADTAAVKQASPLAKAPIAAAANNEAVESVPGKSLFGGG